MLTQQPLLVKQMCMRLDLILALGGGWKGLVPVCKLMLMLYLCVCVCVPVLLGLSKSQPELVHTCCGYKNILNILHD